MTATWKTVRVFISSTFRDMHAERDHLVRVVFPELRERCVNWRLHLVEVDLRWGVTEQDAERGKALEICLHEIEDCRPFFVGMLGERYGWIPSSYDIPDDDKFDSIRSMEPGYSITAMEICHGVLNNPRMRTHAFFYFRDPAFIDSLPEERQPDFRAESPEHAEKLARLKALIRASGLPVMENYRYDDLEAFGRRVLEELWAAIQEEHAPPEERETDPLLDERTYHDFFIETRTELFVGQRHLLARLHRHAGGNFCGPMVVTGTPGCGKSALLAEFVSQFRQLEPETFLIYHFVGASPSSTDPQQMLLRLCQELGRRFRYEEEIPQDPTKLRAHLRRFLQQAAEQGRLVVVIDALNQLDETQRSRELDWLPGLLPVGLRLFVSSLDGDALEAVRRRFQQRREMMVTPLRLVDQGFIIAHQLAQSRKRLTTVRKYRHWRAERLGRGQEIPTGECRSQLRYILTSVYSRPRTSQPEQTIRRETANPLYLKLVAEELRLFGDFDRLEPFIAELPTDVSGMFHTVLDRLEHDHGRELVERSLCLITTSQHGLLEGELLELLARPDEDLFPMALLSRLFRNLSFYMKPRASVGGGEEGLIDFFHQQLTKVVRDRYLPNESLRQGCHRDLAAYFREKCDPAHDKSWVRAYRRGIKCLCHHLHGAELWQQLEECRHDTGLIFCALEEGALGGLNPPEETVVQAIRHAGGRCRFAACANDALYYRGNRSFIRPFLASHPEHTWFRLEATADYCVPTDSSECQCVQISPTLEDFAASDGVSTVLVRMLPHQVVTLPVPASQMCFSRSGRLLGCISDVERLVTIIDTDCARVVAQTSAIESPRACTFTADEGWLIVTGDVLASYHWERDEVQVAERFDGNPMLAVSIGPDGQVMSVGHRDFLTIWDTARNTVRHQRVPIHRREFNTSVLSCENGVVIVHQGYSPDESPYKAYVARLFGEEDLAKGYWLSPQTGCRLPPSKAPEVQTMKQSPGAPLIAWNSRDQVAVFRVAGMAASGDPLVLVWPSIGREQRGWGEVSCMSSEWSGDGRLVLAQAVSRRMELLSFVLTRGSQPDRVARSSRPEAAPVSVDIGVRLMSSDGDTCKLLWGADAPPGEHRTVRVTSTFWQGELKVPVVYRRRSRAWRDCDLVTISQEGDSSPEIEFELSITRSSDGRVRLLVVALRRSLAREYPLPGLERVISRSGVPIGQLVDW